MKPKPNTDATETIQKMIDTSPTVQLDAGVYTISRPLRLHDGTTLIMDKNTVLRLADHANCSVIDNDGIYTRSRNRNITVTGGVIDGNHARQERRALRDGETFSYDTYVGNSLLVLAVRFLSVDGLTLRDVTFRDPTTYAVHISDSADFLVENITFDFDLKLPNMDGIHIQGPAKNGVIRNIVGNANDDHVALCANGTARSEVTHGVIENITVDGVHADNGYTGVRLLSCGDEVRNIRISGVTGCYRYYGVSFTHHYPLENKRSYFENIELKDLAVSKSTSTRGNENLPWCTDGMPDVPNRTAPVVWFENGVTGKSISIDRLTRDEKNAVTEAPTVQIDPDVVLEDVRISGISQTFAGKPCEAIKNSGCVSKLEVVYK